MHILLRPINPADIRSIRGMHVCPTSDTPLINFLHIATPFTLCYAGQYGGFTPLSGIAVPGLDAVGEVVTSSGAFDPGQRVVATGWPIQHGNGGCHS